MLPFCEPEDYYSIPWVNGGISRCFLGVVGSMSCAGVLILLGLTIIVLGPKSKDTKVKQLISKILILEVVLSAIMSLTYVVDLSVKGALHLAGAREKIYGYTIVEDSLGIVSWIFSILILYTERLCILKGAPHGISLALFWILNIVWLSLQIVSFNNPQWWWHLETRSDISDLVLYVIRVTFLSVIVVFGIIRPLCCSLKTRRSYSLLLNADETEEDDIDTEETNKQNMERKEGSFIRMRTTSAFSDFMMKAKLLFPYVWPKGTCMFINMPQVHIHVPYSTEITPTLIACYKAATGGMGLISKTVVLPRN